ncbi:hypothetical protein PBAC_28220 [Pedobacter glucosidilyticus]|nr:glycosyltransferase family 1 protein [Pedobacter glucosidilyticus]KHJ36977.1 hypothetical protein PBAC_28220 [Pedobacter glucosidilyticus]
MAAIKALVISKYFKPDIDGVGDHSYKLINALKDFNLEIEIVTSSKNNSFNNTHYNSLNSINSIFPLLRLNKIIKPDIIILQYVGYNFNTKGIPIWLILLVKILKHRKTKLITIVHETYIRPGNSIKTKILSYLQRLCLKLILNSSTMVFTSIERYLSQCKKCFNKASLLRIGSNITPTNTPFKTNDSYFLIWGDRNHSKALNIFKHMVLLDKNTPNLKIIGKLSFENLKIIESFIENNNLKNRITLLGIVEEEELSITLRNTKGLLLIEELITGEGGFSLKSGIAIAAIQHQTLIFSNKGDMTDSILENNKHLIFLPISEMESAQTIINVLNNEVLIMDLKSHLNHLKENFEWKSIASKIYETIK